MAAEAEPVEQLERGRERVFLVLDVLLQQHLPLALELGLGEARVLDDVAEHAHEARRVPRHAAHVEGGVVLVGVGVDVGAELLGVEVDLLAAAPGRALERHVLDEVADAAFLPALAGAAAVHEHADAGALQVRQGNGDDAHAVAEGGEQGVAGRGQGRHESGHCEWHADCVADGRILEGRTAPSASLQQREEAGMQIRVGFEMAYRCPQPTPMLLVLNIHHTRASDLVRPDLLVLDPPVPLTAYRDLFGNWCSRIVAPAGLLDAAHRRAGQRQRPARSGGAGARCRRRSSTCPRTTLVYLLGSRYCETDQLSDIAWRLFGSGPTGWARVQAICDFVHRHIEFGYQHARRTKTAWEAYQRRQGRLPRLRPPGDRLLPLPQHPGALLHRLPRRHRHAAALRADGLRRLVRGLARRPLVHLRRAQQHAADRPGADGARPRRLRRGALDRLRAEHARALRGAHRRGRRRRRRPRRPPRARQTARGRPGSPSAHSSAGSQRPRSAAAR